MLAPKVGHGAESVAFSEHIERCRLSLPFRNHPMFHANILAGMRIGPARDIACSVDAGGTCFEKFVDEDAAINCEAGLFSKRQTRPHADTGHHKSRFKHLAALEYGALALDGGHGIFEMEYDPMLFVQTTNEITHLRSEGPLHWPFFWRHGVNLDPACAQGCRHLKPDKARTDHERTTRSLRGVNYGAAVGERAQGVNMRLVGARDRQTYRLRTSGQQKPIVGHLSPAGGDDMAFFRINGGDLGIKTQLYA